MGARSRAVFLPPASTFMGFLRPNFHDEGPGTLSCTVEVHDGLKQPMGIVHGGIYCAIAETLASMGAAREVGLTAEPATESASDRLDTVVMGQQNNTTFLRPVTGGHIRAVANCRHKGRTTQVWQIDMFDEKDRLCSVAQVTMAVRPGRG
jgi:uncharacterized protein (TIGR00369 family)